MTLAAAVVAAGVSAVALQQSGTIVLKSGSTLSGELVDLGGSEVHFRVNGEDRAIPKGDVASIDFGGGDLTVPQAARDLPPGTHLAILRNGEVVQGEFYDLMGASPVRIVFRTASGERVFNGPDIRRIYMTKAEGGSTSSTASASGSDMRTITVSARTAWTNTGIQVRSGDELRFETTGEIVFSPRGHVAKSAGSVDGLHDTRAPIPNALQGALIGRIGPTGRAASQPFGIGNLTSVVMPSDGMLFLGVNDSGLGDNRGEFTVKISR
jgi:hypothetical protein